MSKVQNKILHNTYTQKMYILFILIYVGTYRFKVVTK